MAEEYTKSKEVSQLSAALDETSLEQARERFDAARAKVITLAPRERHGIGMQSEKTLHAVLKNYIDSDEDHQEIPIDRYIADIFSGDHIIEIQTANMNAMRAKLACFLPQYPVRVVYPIPAKKQITVATIPVLSDMKRGLQSSPRIISKIMSINSPHSYQNSIFQIPP